MAAQDYGAMLDMFALQKRRYGIENRGGIAIAQCGGNRSHRVKGIGPVVAPHVRDAEQR